MSKLMADRVSRADDKTRREIVLALVDRITIETIREEDDVPNNRQSPLRLRSAARRTLHQPP